MRTILNKSTNMMTEDQIKVVKQVLRRLNDGEDQEWTEIDTSIEALQWLDDDQLVRESEIVLESHSKKTLKCNIVHRGTECFAPKFPEAADAIINLYKTAGYLHPSNRYILEYYITLTNLKVIHD